MIVKYLQIFRLLGPSWAFFRLKYAWQTRGDYWEKKTPMGKWNADVPPITGQFWEMQWTSDLSCQAEEVEAGTYCLFFCHPISGGPVPDWFGIYFAGKKIGAIAQKQDHWSKIADFSSGDIKGVWELSRFAWVYPLIQTKKAETFWDLVEDWAAHNPPNTGVHWKCGQEIAIRMFALTCGFFAFRDDPATTEDREALLREIIFTSAVRIQANIPYALSQKNNHGISEAAGLFTAGVLFDQQSWQDKGMALLESQARELIYEDGSFSQHSVNYHRLMLQVYLWAIQLGRANGLEFSSTLLDRVRKAGLWLLALCDLDTGCCPNLGSNDGALIFPVTESDYLDFRPTIKAAALIMDGHPWLPTGPYDGLATFLGCSPSVSHASHNAHNACNSHNFHDPGTNSPPPLIYFPDGGYAVFTSNPDTRLVFRCPIRFKHRPGHCDLLHVDLFLLGVNVLRDAGSYSYNCELPWQEYFPSVAAHNTIQFDDHDQMPRLSRFLLGKWPKSREVVDESAGQITAGFTDWKGCRHERTVMARENGFTIQDRFKGFKEKAVLRWRLASEIDWELQELTCSSAMAKLTISLEDGSATEAKIVQGWESLYYQERTPVPVLEVQVGASCHTLTTHIQFYSMTQTKGSS